jgi:hypothetical protein
MDTFEALLEALEAYSDAKAEYKKAKDSCQHSHGYFLHHEREVLDRTKKRLNEALGAHIKAVTMKVDCHICEELGPGNCQ